MESLKDMMGLTPEQLLSIMLTKMLAKPQHYTAHIDELNIDVKVIVYRAKLDPKDPEFYYCMGVKPIGKK